MSNPTTPTPPAPTPPAPTPPAPTPAAPTPAVPALDYVWCDEPGASALRIAAPDTRWLYREALMRAALADVPKGLPNPPKVTRSAGALRFCDSCGESVFLTRESLAWTFRGGQWEVSAWTDAAGTCCGHTYVVTTPDEESP